MSHHSKISNHSDERLMPKIFIFFVMEVYKSIRYQIFVFLLPHHNNTAFSLETQPSQIVKFSSFILLSQKCVDASIEVKKDNVMRLKISCLSCHSLPRTEEYETLPEKLVNVSLFFFNYNLGKHMFAWVLSTLFYLILPGK